MRLLNIIHRLAASLLSMNEIYFPLPIKTLLELDVRLGVSSPLSSRKKSQRAQISTLALSVIIARKLRPNLSVCAKMCSMCWMNLSSPRLSPESPRYFIIKCRLRLSCSEESTVCLITESYFRCRKGDYHRYLAEFASGEKRKVAATAAHEAYKVS